MAGASRLPALKNKQTTPMKEAIQEILKQADYYEHESRVNRVLCSHVLATKQAHLAKNLLRIAKLAKLIWP